MFLFLHVVDCIFFRTYFFPFLDQSEWELTLFDNILKYHFNSLSDVHQDWGGGCYSIKILLIILSVIVLCSVGPIMKHLTILTFASLYEFFKKI